MILLSRIGGSESDVRDRSPLQKRPDRQHTLFLLFRDASCTVVVLIVAVPPCVDSAACTEKCEFVLDV